MHMSFVKSFDKDNNDLKSLLVYIYGFIGLVWFLLIIKVLYTFMSNITFGLLDFAEILSLALLSPLFMVYFYRQLLAYVTGKDDGFQKMFKKNPHAMWIYDRKSYQFLTVNDAAVALYGYSAAEFQNMNIESISAAEDVPALLSEDRKDFDHAYQWSGIWRHKKKNNEFIYVEISSYGIIYNRKKAELVLAYNVTDKVLQESKLQTINQQLELKVKERTSDLLHLNKTLIEQNKTIKTSNHNLASLSEELKQANKKIEEHAELKNRFISMVSHEFRTPLATIRFAADFLKRYHSRITTEQLLDKVTSIGKQVAHMDALLNDVLTIGKTDSNKIQTIIDPINLQAFIGGLMNEVVQANNHSHKILLTVGDIPEQINSDEKLLRNIFINLLNNAIKYSPDHDTVLLNIEKINHEIVFKIKDFGMGISAENLTKIFEPFYRTDAVKHIQGTGLGLSIVKRAVELVGGRMEVTSEVGKGSTFVVSLPVR